MALSTKSTMENRNMKCKPEPEVDFGAILAKNRFLGFSRANISVAVGVTRPIYGAISYVWGSIFGENFRPIVQGNHTFVRWDLFGILAFSPKFGAATCPQFDPLPNFFWR